MPKLRTKVFTASGPEPDEVPIAIRQTRRHLASRTQLTQTAGDYDTELEGGLRLTVIK